MKYIIKNKNWKINKEYNKEKLLYLLVDRPTQITSYKCFIWKNNKIQWYRSYDLPAVVWDFGDVWWHHGKKMLIE